MTREKSYTLCHLLLDTHTYKPTQPTSSHTLYCSFQPDSLIAAPIHTTQTYLHSNTKSSLASTKFRYKSSNNIPSASGTSISVFLSLRHPPSREHPSQGHPSRGHPSQGHPSRRHPSRGHRLRGIRLSHPPSRGHPSMGHPSSGLRRPRPVAQTDIPEMERH